MENEEKTIQPKAIQIFAKAPGELGVNVVKSPVKLTILSMLKDTDMEFDEIVKNTGKSKSTISVHLKSLREDGIVSYRFDANDHRKKIFFINSSRSKSGFFSIAASAICVRVLVSFISFRIPIHIAKIGSTHPHAIGTKIGTKSCIFFSFFIVRLLFLSTLLTIVFFRRDSAVLKQTTHCFRCSISSSI